LLLGLKRITLTTAFKEPYNCPSIAILQGRRKGKERSVGRRGVQRLVVVATLAIAAKAKEIEEALDAIEAEDAIADNNAIIQELEEEALQEFLQEEAQDYERFQALREEAQEIAQEIEDVVVARIVREAEIEEQFTQEKAAKNTDLSAITPRHRRKRVRYSPSPIQRRRHRHRGRKRERK